jgi:hypothetical protein
LNGERAEQRLGVLAEYADGRQWDLSREAKYTSSAAKVAGVDGNGVLHAAGDGSATITVEAAGRKIEVPVKVKGVSAETPVSWTREVMPLLSRAACNSGACHGSSRGKDGFRLSLFGYDPDGDYHRLTRESIGRRVNLAIPEESLVAQKALLAP